MLSSQVMPADILYNNLRFSLIFYLTATKSLENWWVKREISLLFELALLWLLIINGERLLQLIINKNLFILTCLHISFVLFFFLVFRSFLTISRRILHIIGINCDSDPFYFCVFQVFFGFFLIYRSFMWLSTCLFPL